MPEEPLWTLGKRSGGECATLCCWEIATAYERSARLSAEVGAGEFRGTLHRVWVDAGELRRFVGQLEALDTTLTGEARLSAMSPGEMSVWVGAIDRLGHLQMQVTITRRRPLWEASPPTTDSVTAMIGIEPSELEGLREEFEDLHRRMMGSV